MGMSFEEAITRLEYLANALEQDTLPLEEALCSFEEGVRLVRFCNEKLTRAQQQVEQLVDQNGQWVKRPFAGDG